MLNTTNLQATVAYKRNPLRVFAPLREPKKFSRKDAKTRRVKGLTQILPGTGRWREAAEGPLSVDPAVSFAAPDPSARSSGHLPVPVRI